MFARGGDLSMYRQHVAADGTPAGWSALGGGITSNPGSTFDGANTYVFACAGDGGDYYQKIPPAAPAPGGSRSAATPVPIRIRSTTGPGSGSWYAAATTTCPGRPRASSAGPG